MRRIAIATALILALATGLRGDPADLPSCGTFIADPIASASDAVPRVCPPVQQRKYVRRHAGLAYEILDSESEACFVPDSHFELMDALVDDVVARLPANPPGMDAEYARRVSSIIGETLLRHGFAFYTPTDPLSDTFERRGRPEGPELHVFDCDTSSFIYLTIAESLGLSASLVEITYRYGDSGHNYVRWHLANGTSLDWDTNGRFECSTPKDQPRQLGRAMTREEALGYALSLRAKLWERRQAYKRALVDNRRAQFLYADGAMAPNNLAWLVATRDFPGRRRFIAEAFSDAKRAVELVDMPNYLDTLACVYALKGDYRRAVETEQEAFRREPNSSYGARLKLLRRGVNCTGAK